VATKKPTTQDLKEQLNAAQYEAVTTTQGPVLVIAGAGSGKTRVIEFRALHLVQSGVDPESILLLTFTRRSAQEMIQRASRNDPRCAKIDGGTFHSFASRILRRNSRPFGLSSSFTIYDEGDAEEAIRRCCNKIGYDQDKEFPKKNELKSVFSVCVNKDVSVDDAVQKMYSDYDDWIGDIKVVQKEYTEYKRRNNCLDYDDLLIYLKLVLDNPEVRQKISSQYRYIMVDEYQDTNRVQADIVELLSKENGNVMAVGDDAQSIYGFRGANHLNILRFPERFPGCKVIKLEENYRSTQPILDVGNAVLTNMKDKFEKRLVSGIGLTGEKPSLHQFNDMYEEADWVARRVEGLRASGVPVREIAILFRTAYAAMPLQSELIKRDIRFRLFGGRKFYETAHVRDVIAYLRIVANPIDELAWHRVLLLLPGIGTKTVERLLQLISTQDNLARIIDTAITPFCSGQKHSDTLASFRDLLQSINSPSVAPAQALDRVISHYEPIMKVKHKKDASRTKELLMLRNMAKRYGSLKEFLADVSVDPDKEGPDDSEYLTLSTVHSAKGLEWGRVFLIGLVDGVFPSGKAVMGDDSSEIEEEQRLFYVAVTRAKDELFMSLYNRSGSGEKPVDGPSRFLTPKNVQTTIEQRSFAPVVSRGKTDYYRKFRRR
jgi:DNA helicase II / ATP-dependent DNA helicase PcrA